MKSLHPVMFAALVAVLLLGGVRIADARFGPVAPPAETVAPPPATRAASFVPIHVGDFPPEAIAAWDKVNASLLRHITLTVDVEVTIEWKPIDGGFIGMGGSLGSRMDFPNAAFANTWYPVSLANQIAGTRLADGPDIGVDMSSIVPWDYSGDPPKALREEKNDYVTTLMHEILHGMGFSGTANWVDGEGTLGDGETEPDRKFAHLPTAATAAGRVNPFLCVVPAAKVAPKPVSRDPLTGEPLIKRTVGALAVWDHFVVDGDGNLLTNEDVYANPSEELGDALTGDDLFWNGAGGVSANNGKPVKLYAPAEWSGPSSYSHLDDATYDGGPDSILTSAGEKMPNIELGPRVIGILGDMGWKVK